VSRVKRMPSVSETIRKLLLKALKDEESVDEALDTESLRESVKRDNNRLGRRLSWLLVWLIDVAILFRTHGDKELTQHTRCVR
jgi:hypothetical protein